MSFDPPRSVIDAGERDVRIFKGGDNVERKTNEISVEVTNLSVERVVSIHVFPILKE